MTHHTPGAANGTSSPAVTGPATSKGQRRRQEIIEGAAAILREQGPGGVTHRAVAERVGCSLSATTYYFSGLEDLLASAGRLNISRWASRAERVAEDVEGRPAPPDLEAKIELVLAATVPTDEELWGHYHQLTAAGSAPPVSRAYHTGRDRLNAAVTRVLRRVGSSRSAALIIAVVDGAAVSALSEGRDVREYAADMLREVL